MIEYYPWIVVISPFIGFIINILIGSYLSKGFVNLIGLGSVLISFVFSVLLFFLFHGPVVSASFPWVNVDEISVDLALYVDQLALVMILVVSGVGFIIHVYSTGYMTHDKRYSRYFAYLNLFTGFMLLLVLAKNMLLMFVGWEGVGLCSYLLISFWFDDLKKGLENSGCGLKAFIVNRIGDFGFTVGLLMLLVYVGTTFGEWTFDIPAIRHIVESNKELISGSLITACCLLFFVGATGKSAQIPLYVWLPDAMAGPTPVSALIHAATMVTAGVYMVCRFNFLYDLSPFAMNVVATVGAVTALFAATIGFCQNDIKKVLAYSTISQIGFMFLGAGVGAYAAAIFHLVTHAFFKACLFLGAGSVIHSTGEQDIRNLGGLKRYMPITFITFLIAALAISGIPPLSGFFSKDEILLKTFTTSKALWLIAVIAAFCTAFYMSRLLFLTFYGAKYHGASGTHGHTKKVASVDHPHESPWNMTLPLLMLAGLAIAGGIIGLPHAFGAFGLPDHYINKIESFLHHVFKDSNSVVSTATEWSIMITSLVVSIAGIALAYVMYILVPGLPKIISESAKDLYKVLSNKYYVDEVYQGLIVRPLLEFNVKLGKFDYDVIDEAVNVSGESTGLTSHYTGRFDNEVVDDAVNGVSELVMDTGGRLKKIQTGNIKTYIATALVGALFMIAFFCFYTVREQIVALVNAIFGVTR